MARQLAPALALLVLAAAGCGSAAAGANTRPGGTEVVHDAQSRSTVGLYREPGRASQNLAAAPEAAWAQVGEVYRELGLPVTSADPASRVIVSAGQRLRRVGDRGIASYFDCGGGFGNAAAQYQVTVTTRTQLTAAEGGGTQVTITTEASARAPSGHAQVRCNSTGLLERTIGERLAIRTTGG